MKAQHNASLALAFMEFAELQFLLADNARVQLNVLLVFPAFTECAVLQFNLAESVSAQINVSVITLVSMEFVVLQF